MSNVHFNYFSFRLFSNIIYWWFLFSVLFYFFLERTNETCVSFGWRFCIEQVFQKFSNATSVCFSPARWRRQKYCIVSMGRCMCAPHSITCMSRSLYIHISVSFCLIRSRAGAQRMKWICCVQSVWRHFACVLWTEECIGISRWRLVKCFVAFYRKMCEQDDKCSLTFCRRLKHKQATKRLHRWRGKRRWKLFCRPFLRFLCLDFIL